MILLINRIPKRPGTPDIFIGDASPGSWQRRHRKTKTAFLDVCLTDCGTWRNFAVRRRLWPRMPGAVFWKYKILIFFVFSGKKTDRS